MIATVQMLYVRKFAAVVKWWSCNVWFGSVWQVGWQEDGNQVLDIALIHNLWPQLYYVHPMQEILVVQDDSRISYEQLFFEECGHIYGILVLLYCSYIYLIVIPWPRRIRLIYMPQLEGVGIYIRRILSGHGITNIYHFSMLTKKL